jgi:LPS-assembly protein
MIAMPRFLGIGIVVVATSLAALGGPAKSLAATGVGAPEQGKPLGTLWYPGPYDPNQAPAAQPSPVIQPAPIAPADRPLGPPALAPAPSLPPVSAPQADKPLGTLWYPGPFDPTKTAQPVATPVTAPTPATPAPAAPQRPVELPAISADKPLGTLWYPGPYDPATGQAAPTPAPAMAPAETPGRAAQPAVPALPDAIQSPTSAQQQPRPTVGDGGRKLDGDRPVQLSADEMSYDQEQGVITAYGNVEIIHGGRRLRADVIVYNQRTDVVSASGNIELTEPSGERIFASAMDVTGDFKDAVVQSIGVILTDRSRIAAVAARRSDETVTEFRKGVYSPCNLCKTDPTRPPLWQLKAVKVVHDKDQQTIEYRDAWMEVFGIPVAYTPYFSHPDPTVKRKTGLLAPSWGGSSDLGYVLRVPYFFNISPNEDATLTALGTTKGGSGGILEYRGRYQKGRIDATGSLVSGDSASDEDFRGHIDAKGRFDIDDTWRWGFDANRATDDTYTRRYGFTSPPFLDSRLFAEGFRRRNYFSFNTYAFQDLRGTSESGFEPYVMPLLDYNHVGETDRFGGQTLMDVNMLALTRTDGTDTRRLSIRPGWQLPFIGPLGDAYKLTFSLNADLYHVDELDRTSVKKAQYSGFAHRVTPLAMFDWRYPLVRPGNGYSQVIEPIMVAAYSPNGGNPDTIPNEDSKELEFDDTNLFSANKFSGLDRVEGGARVNYGVKWGVYGKGKDAGSTSAFIGQSYRPRTDSTFATGTGLEENFSDVVGRIRVSPGPLLNAVYRTRIDGDNFSPKRNEVLLSAGPPALNFSGNYVFIQPQAGSQFPGREELSYAVKSRLNRYWRASVSGITDLDSSDTRAISARLIFENECLIFTTNATRTFYEDRDLKPSDQITFSVVFKTLGEVHTGISGL